MREEAQTAVRAVEEATGIPVLVSDDAALRTMASIKPAKKGAPAHILKYHPKFAAVADYMIAYQCGFALRRILSPEAARFELAATDQGRETAGELVDERLKQSDMRLPLHVATGLRDQVFNGLLTQLRSIPVGLRVDSWVRKEYPGLHSQQEEATRLQLAENQQALGPEVKKLAPAKIYDASVGMSAAFASFWEKFLTDPTLVVAFRLSGHLAAGEQLLRISDEIPDEPANDKGLIEAWGEHLGITGWFRLIPVEA